MTSPKKGLAEIGGNPYCRLMQDECPDLPKLCLLKGECYHCAFEQWLQALGTQGDGSTGKPARVHSTDTAWMQPGPGAARWSRRVVAAIERRPCHER